MKSVRYSFIIPTLNEEKFLTPLLESLVIQTRKNFEVIVVDGKSKDRTVDIAKTYTKKLPLTVIKSPKASLPLQRNLGAKEARGDWYIFIDADSVIVPHFIERISTFIEEENPSFFTTWMRPDSSLPGDANIALLGNMMFEMAVIFKRPIPSGPLTIVSKEAFEKVHGYDEAHEYNEDVDFSMRILKAHFAHHIIPETLFIWSLRRFREQGTLKVIQQYTISAFPVLLFNKPLKYMPSYIMGGHMYKKKKISLHKKLVKTYEVTLKKLRKEIGL